MCHYLKLNGEFKNLSLIQRKLRFLGYFSITSCVRKITKDDTYLRYVCLSVRTPICLNTAVAKNEFSRNFELKIFSKIYIKIEKLLKSDKNDRYST